MASIRQFRVWMALIALIVPGIVSQPVHAQQGEASWYSTEACRVNKNPRCPTADGSSLYVLQEQGIAYAAMWDVPLGSYWSVCQQDRGDCAVVQIRDRGPNRRLGRLIDLNPESFKAVCGALKRGVCQVTIEPQ